MDSSLCVGDFICIYCEDSGGFVFNLQSSSAYNSVHIHHKQSKTKPANVPNSHAITFEVCVKNRFKLDKVYRKLLEQSSKHPDDTKLKAKVAEAKVGAEAECNDNLIEQKRQHGRRLRYGQVIQLRHVFTGKYIHVSTQQTSQRDKNFMKVLLSKHNAKHAMFKALPRFKVKSEGDIVQRDDQVIFESAKSPGQYLHSSSSFVIDNFNVGCELNLGVHKSGFTLIRHHRPKKEENFLVRGGSVIRFYHKELEAYLVAEGVFGSEVKEDAHLRVRPMDQSKPKTMLPSTSAITYWQIESEQSLTNGDVIHWQQQVRIRHLMTRLYLCITPSGKIAFTDTYNDPKTVFRLHPVIQERDEIEYESYSRIEHVLTGFWLHGMKEEDYIKKGSTSSDSKALAWDKATLKQIGSVRECLYDDAFTLQRVGSSNVQDFNDLAGMMHTVLDFHKNMTLKRVILPTDATGMMTTLTEIKEFMIVNGEYDRDRQKLVRNLGIVDVLVDFMQNYPKGASNDYIFVRLVVCAYDILEYYLEGDSRKNELYFSKYIPYIFTQFDSEGILGLKATSMGTESLRDNRKIVDRIQKKDIDAVIELLGRHKNYHYLDYLGVLCVCDGVALPENQSYITKKWLVEQKYGVFFTMEGSKIGKQKGKIYVSKDIGRTWKNLGDVCDRSLQTFSEGDYMFLEKQLELFGLLCQGRNDFTIKKITEELDYLTWSDAFTCLKDTSLPDDLRAKYCNLIITLFVDVGSHRSILDQLNLAFKYKDLGGAGRFRKTIIEMKKESGSIFPFLRDWIAHFLVQNKDMTASDIGHNLLIEQVLLLLHHLVKFGYYGDSHDIKQLLSPLLNLLDGRNDKLFPEKKEDGPELAEIQKQYRSVKRFEQSPETKAIVQAKLQALEVVELLLNFEFSQRLEKFVTLFKSSEKMKQADISEKKGKATSTVQLRRKASNDLQQITLKTTYFEEEQITDIFMDLAKYQYDDIIRKAMMLLNKYYSATTDMFSQAVQAQVLITGKSIKIHHAIENKMPILKRLSNAKLDEDQAKSVCDILNRYIKFCHLENEPDERHPINQTILVNHGILEIAFDILRQKIDVHLQDHYKGIVTVLKATLKLLQYLAKGNVDVQTRIFGHLDVLLDIKGVEPELANTLVEAFAGNQSTCLRIMPKQIQKIVQLAAEHQGHAPEFLDLLNAIVKIEGLNLPLKRNQGYVMKYVMQNYQKVAFLLDITAEASNGEEDECIYMNVSLSNTSSDQTKLLLHKAGPQELSYLISLVDLFATCAEGENRFIESLCQTIFSMDVLFEIIDNSDIDNNLKRPYLRFLLWTYLSAAGGSVDMEISAFPTKSCKWQRELVEHIKEMTEYMRENKSTVALLLKKGPPKKSVASTPEGKAYGTIHYFFDAVFPFLEVFYHKGFVVGDIPELQEIVDRLANALLVFSSEVSPLISNPHHLRTLVQTVTSVVTASEISIENAAFLLKNGSIEVARILSKAQEEYHEYYQQEQLLNEKLNWFANNFKTQYEGENTVMDQIGVPGKREYTDVGGDEELPLGEEFQRFVRCFIKIEKDRHRNFERVGKLVTCLSISASKLREFERNHPSQVALDVKCLQVLRALIHNEERKLPETWNETDKKIASQLDVIHQTQCALDSFGVIIKTMPLIDRKQDAIVKEYMSFMAMMLFNANRECQKSLEEYCRQTRDEMFFVAIKQRIQMSTVATKERRFLVAQYESKMKEDKARAETFRATISGTKVTQKNGTDNDGLLSDEELEMPVIEYRDEGHMELLLKLLAMVCDGQNETLQNYLREQPDNIKSVNLVAETSSFLSLLYSHVDSQSIALIIQIFETLNEFASGRPANHHVIYDNNIVEYINFILRSGTNSQCTEEEMLELVDVMAILLLSMVEENKPTNRTLQQEITNSMDTEIITKVAVDCYLKSQKSEGQEKESLLDVGFKYFFIYKRMASISDDLKAREKQMKIDRKSEAFSFYEKHSKAIEIIKDDELQQVRFRVREEIILREAAKEKMKWSVDRSSPSNKVQELMEWSRDIIDDIYYQRKIRAHAVSDFLIRFWGVWNFLCMFLSLVINILMLATWKSKGSLADIVSESDTELPQEIYNPIPDVPTGWYPVFFYILAGLHNVCSLLVVITFFLSSRPKIPTKGWCQRKFAIQNDLEVQKKHVSQLRIDFLSFVTFYYMLFLAFSIGGTICYGYFFVFHLLNIVYNNPLLQRVIQAVTLNGKSLLWVAVLGVIIIYIYAIIAFAAFRSHMNPEGEVAMYCGTLGECTVSIIRYGLIGEVFEHFKPHEIELSFEKVGILAIFQISFFIVITTIGLNIIFGIILDTFSELRALKWNAEQDMKSTCYICGRSSYEFETFAKGFVNHVKADHNLWAYIFFFVHLDGTKVKDYTTLELYVHQQTNLGKLDFFPIGKALALSAKDDNLTEEKIDDILLKVDNILIKQDKEEAKKLKEHERRRQKQWEELHREDTVGDSDL